MALRGHGFLGVSNRLTTNNQPNIIMAKTYICTATIQVTVEAEDEFDAPFEAGMHLDVGDIDWDVEEGSSEDSCSCQSLTNITTKV